MGYYTYYSLHLEGEPDKVKACEEDIIKSLDIGEELVKFGTTEAKWYDSDADMREIAERHPDVLICLSGDGEDSDDLWEARYLGRQSEYHQVVMPPFTQLLIKSEKEKLNNKS